MALLRRAPHETRVRFPVPPIQSILLLIGVCIYKLVCTCTLDDYTSWLSAASRSVHLFNDASLLGNYIHKAGLYSDISRLYIHGHNRHGCCIEKSYVADVARTSTPWFTVEVPCEDWYLRVEPLGIAVIISVTQSLLGILGITTHSLTTPRHFVTRTRLPHCLLLS